MKNVIVNLLIVAGIILTMNSCSDTPSNETTTYSNGLLIANQGSFTANNASISFYDYDKDKVVNNIFKEVNGRNIGDVVQSITISGAEAYVIVNNSNKIEKVKKSSMEEITTIDIDGPRYMLVNGGVAYISSWTVNGVVVMDISTNQMLDTIVTGGNGPEKMIIAGNYLYVANKGGFSVDSTVGVINLTSRQLEKTLQVGHQPSDMVKTSDGNIWLLCAGQTIWDAAWTNILGHKPCKLHMIDASAQRVAKTGTLFEEQHPEHLEIDNDGATMYLGGGFSFEGVWEITVDGSTIAGTEITDDIAYTINYDSATDKLFVTVASFTSNSTLKRYETDGTLLGTYEIGIGGGELQLRSRF